jgi:hypothetical protein
VCLIVSMSETYFFERRRRLPCTKYVFNIRIRRTSDFHNKQGCDIFFLIYASDLNDFYIFLYINNVKTLSLRPHNHSSGQTG